MLRDQDRIFTNLYGFDDWRLAGAQRRGDWDGTREIIAKGRDWIIEQLEACKIVIEPAATEEPAKPKDTSRTRPQKGGNVRVTEPEGAEGKAE